MIQEAIESIFQKGQNSITKERQVNIKDRGYFVNNNGELVAILVKKDILEINTLTGLIDYCRANEHLASKSYIVVSGYDQVDLVSHLNEWGKRDRILSAQPEIRSFPFNGKISAEDFNIQVQASFEDSENKSALLSVARNVIELNSGSISCDGTSQEVKIGMKAPNPIKLRPFCTFSEIEQPERNFIFKVHANLRMTLSGSQGGIWEIETIQRIKDFLMIKLPKWVIIG